jgi:hypothetical protein
MRGTVAGRPEEALKRRAHRQRFRPASASRRTIRAGNETPTKEEVDQMQTIKRIALGIVPALVLAMAFAGRGWP